ncbi:MAG TPA: hypothetical protein VEF55_12590 [Candidatus Binatia bacterium]|nr:hypothetical protein [Candidatus Binatia bacterium]
MAKRGNLEPPERVEETSADLAYELQAKLFEQLATVSLGGVGLTLTLSGTILSGAQLSWIATAEFAVAALIAIAAQQQLIGSLFERRATRKRSKLMTGLCLLFVGMGSGSLATAIFLEGPGRTLFN